MKEQISSNEEKQSTTNLLLFKNTEWMNKEEAASYLRLTPTALQMRITRGQIEAYKLGNSIRLKRSELDKLLEASIANKEVSNDNK